MNTLELGGLDGANPLGMLAALGALRVATLRDPGVRMGWRDAARIHPFMVTRLSMEGLAAAVCEEAERIAKDVASPEYGDIIRVPKDHFRVWAARSIPDSGLPATISDADYLASWASDAVLDEGEVLSTRLSFSNKSGQQFLLKDFRRLTADCTPDEVTANLCVTDAVLREGTNLNWDPSALRSYALRWKKPDSDPKRTNSTLNSMAFLGLSVLPVVPGRHDLETTGVFEAREERRVEWRWPIWSSLLPWNTVRCLVALRALAGRPAEREVLRRSGVAHVFAARRITDNKRYYFSPAEEV